MTLRHAARLFMIACLPSIAIGANWEPVQAQRPNQREQARQEFVAARQAFADILITVMSSEQLAARVRETSVAYRQEQAEERLNQVRNRLQALETEGRTDSDEARRLRQRMNNLKKETGELGALLEKAVEKQDSAIVTKVIAGQFKSEIDKETEYLADVLETSELTNRAAQLRQMVKLGQFAGGINAAFNEQPYQAQEAPPVIDEAPPVILPAGATVSPGSDIE